MKKYFFNVLLYFLGIIVFIITLILNFFVPSAAKVLGFITFWAVIVYVLYAYSQSRKSRK